MILNTKYINIIMNKLQVSLLIALIMLPLSATLIHLHVHGDIQWLMYLTIFDTVVITGLFIYSKTRIYGFWLNTLIGLSGIIYHAQFSFMGTLSDSMIILADVCIGFALITVFETKVRKSKRRRK